MTSIIARVSAPARGPGGQESLTLHLQSLAYTWSWGSQPAQGGLTYVATGELPAIFNNSWIEVDVFGRTFYGVLQNGPGRAADNSVIPTMRSSGGNTLEARFVDTRMYLQWDQVFGCWNRADVRIVNNRRVKRYWHILPANWASHRKTFTDTPYTAMQILESIFTAPTIETLWVRVYHADQAVFPVYEVDALGGRRLDELVTEITETQGLVFTLMGGPFRLVWARKGEVTAATPGLSFPSSSDAQGLTYELTGNPTRVFVVGERNLYLVLDLGLVPDWNRNWEEILDVDVLADDLFTRVAAFNTVAGDIEETQGRMLAAARARDITVREYAALRVDLDFADYRKFGGRSRMDMPAALYLQTLLFRAFRPPGTVTIRGVEVPIESLDVAQEMIAEITHDPDTGEMEADVTRTAGGNGYAIAKGYQAGSEIFKSIRPERFNVDNFETWTDGWQPVTFQIDDSGIDGKFMIFDQPILRMDDVVQIVDGFAVLNASPTFQTPEVRAALTFEGDPYVFTAILAGSPGRAKDGTLNVPGLRGEYVIKGTSATEVPFADGFYANDKALQAAQPYLNKPWVYAKGSYQWKLREGDVLPDINPLIDRVTVECSAGGMVCTVDLTAERPVRNRMYERDLERWAALNAMMPGQKELKDQANVYRLLAQAFRQSPDLAKRLGGLLNGRLGGTHDLTPLLIEDGTDVLSVGTPLWKKPVTVGSNAGGTWSPNTDTRVVMPTAVADGHVVFAGVTVREGEKADRTVFAALTGEQLCRVLGPVSVNDLVGRANGVDYLTRIAPGEETSRAVGKVVTPIGVAEVKLTLVLLGASGGGGGGVSFNVWA
jgi:hypothetical protein